MLIDSGGRVVTQRRHPTLALASADPLPDGSVQLSAPERAPLTVAVPDPLAAGTVPVEIFSDKIEAVLADAAAHSWFTAFLGTPTRLVHLDDPAVRRPIDPGFSRPGETVSLADGYPLLVTTLASLDALNSLIAQGDHPDEGPLPMDRFRPNVVVNGTAPWAEDDWKLIRIGEVLFRAVKPCARCVVTTTDQHTGERGKEPLRTLSRHHGIGDKGDKPAFGQNLIPEHTGTIRIGDPVEVLA
jgi:uncharacterized protein YcbX